MSITEQAFTANTVVTLSEEYAAKAARGVEITALMKALKDEKAGIDKVFSGLFDHSGQRTFLNAKGEVVVTIDHGQRQILDQAKLKADKPEVVAAYQTLSTWDTPHYKG